MILRYSTQVSNILLVFLLILKESHSSSYVSEQSDADCDGGLKVFPFKHQQHTIFFCHKTIKNCKPQNFTDHPLKTLIEQRGKIRSGDRVFWIPVKPLRILQNNSGKNFAHFRKAFHGEIEKYGEYGSYKVCTVLKLSALTSKSESSSSVLNILDPWKYVLMVVGAIGFLILIAGVYSVYSWKEDERYAKRQSNSSAPSSLKSILKNKNEELYVSTSFTNESPKMEYEGRASDQPPSPGERSVKDEELVGMTSEN